MWELKRLEDGQAVIITELEQSTKLAVDSSWENRELIGIIIAGIRASTFTNHTLLESLPVVHAP